MRAGPGPGLGDLGLPGSGTSSRRSLTFQHLPLLAHTPSQEG